MNTAIIAHRGASALAKRENTIESFLIAINLHADYVEFDIRMTKDHVLVVFHDSHINGKALSSITYSELSAEAAKDGYTVPFLEDVLKVCKGKIKLDIELKEAGYEKEVIKQVIKYYDYDEFMMKSFLDSAVFNIKKYDHNITTGLLVGTKTAGLKRRLNEYFPLRRMWRCGADFISPHRQLATREFIKRMHLHKKKVYVWTVNKPENIYKFLKKHVDGIITDKPNVGLQIKRLHKHRFTIRKEK